MFSLNRIKLWQWVVPTLAMLLLIWGLSIAHYFSWTSRLHKQGIGFRAVLPPPVGSKSDISLIWFGHDGTDQLLEQLQPEFQQLTGVEHVNLNYSRVTGPGLKYLTALPKLESIGLEGAAVDDHGLQGLRGLGHIKELKLNHTSIGDPGVSTIADECSQINVLDLSDTRITDKCVPDLIRFQNLRHLQIAGTAITDARAEELRRALPQLCILVHKRERD